MIAWLLIGWCAAQDTSAADPRRTPPVIAEAESLHQKVIDAVSRCVVKVVVDRDREPAPKRGPVEFPGAGGPPFDTRPQGPTSGTIVSADGLVLTSFFNIEGRVRRISIVLSDGSSREASVVGYDAPLDLALLKIEAQGLPTLPPAPLDTVRVGQFVYALGRAPNGDGITFNQGIVSAFDRFGGTTWQIDVKGNFGNAGGPVVDREGRFIGILARIHTRHAATFGQNSGVSFVIPWREIDRALPKLKAGTRVEVRRDAFLGISFDPSAPERGAVVQDVIEGTAAERAGLKKGDVIVEFGGKSIENPTELRAEILRRRPGDTVRVRFIRDGREREVDVTLGERIREE